MTLLKPSVSSCRRCCQKHLKQQLKILADTHCRPSCAPLTQTFPSSTLDPWDIFQGRCHLSNFGITSNRGSSVRSPLIPNTNTPNPRRLGGIGNSFCMKRRFSSVTHWASSKQYRFFENWLRDMIGQKSGDQQ